MRDQMLTGGLWGLAGKELLLTHAEEQGRGAGDRRAKG